MYGLLELGKYIMKDTKDELCFNFQGAGAKLLSQKTIKTKTKQLATPLKEHAFSAVTKKKSQFQNWQ